MLRYVGLDVHKRLVQACILDHHGAVLHESRFDLTQSSLLDFAQAHLGQEAKVVLEATTNTWAVVRLLKPHALAVIVSNPVQTKAIAQAKVKTDKVDAKILAQLLRADFLPTVWEPDERTQQLRSLTTRRSSLSSDRTATKNRLHAVLAERLIQAPDDLFGKAGREWLASTELDELGRAAVASELRLLDSLEVEIDAVELELCRRGWQDDRVKLLLSLPGVDVVCAQAILAAFGDFTRFKDPDQCAAYLGLVPSVKQSAESCHYGSITKTGNGHTRWLMIQAAQHVGKHPGPLGAFYRRLVGRKNHNLAVVATARKLVVIAWHMLKNNEPYRYAQPRSTEAKLSRLRLRGGGPRRRGGTAKGSPKPQPVGGPSRRVKPLAEVLQGEGLPAPVPLSAGEQKMLQESGTQEFAASLKEEKRVPRSAKKKARQEETAQA